MKSRHAAALLLVGWYLMMPPTPWDSTKGWIDGDAPLSSWFLVRGFDTAKECERAREKKYNEASREMHVLAESHSLETNPRAQILAQDMFNRCIATDDPRLKNLTVEANHSPFKPSTTPEGPDTLNSKSR